MNKLRDRTHIILIVLVIAFLATIIFEWGMNYLSTGSSTTFPLGSVNGVEINYQDFEARVQMTIDQQKQQTGQDPDEAMMQMIRDQVWDQMVTEMIAKEQIEKLGIQVTDQEVVDWVYKSPETLPDPIKRNFIDSTGQFNMALYQQVLQTKTPEIQNFWNQVETYLKQVLLSQKLQSVITGVVRVPETDIKQQFVDENISADINYLFLDVNSITDESIQISEDDLKKFYDKNKEDFRIEESAKLKYILFSDLPTVEDSALVERNLAALKKDLRTLKDSALIEFINSNSDNKWTGNFLKPNELSSEVANYLFNAQKDSVSNVIKSSDGYHLVRLLESKDGENLFYSASHILINFGTDTNAAKVKAEQILQRLKSGEDFNKLATEVSDDPGSKTNGGSLGWFTKGAMVKEFEDAVVNAKVGEIVGVIKTQYGYHIIKVHDRQKKEFKIADIKQTVKTSTKTKDAVLKKAEDFVFVAEKSSFDEEAKKLNFQILEAPNITKDAFIPNAGQNKKVSEFALKQKTGSISTPVKIQNGYAVYYIESQSPAGYSNFEEIKENIIRPRVLLEKKLEILHQRAVELKSKIPDNNLAALNSMNENVSVLAADSISAAKPNQNIGAEPAFNYTVFKMQNGQISEPIKTQRGYYLVQVRNITPFDQSKYEAAAETIRTNLLQQKKQMFISEWIEDLKNKAEIVDNRDKYFR